MKAGLGFKESQLELECSGGSAGAPDLLFFDEENRVLDRSGRLCLLSLIICSVCVFSSGSSGITRHHKQSHLE